MANLFCFLELFGIFFLLNIFDECLVDCGYETCGYGGLIVLGQCFVLIRLFIHRGSISVLSLHICLTYPVSQ